MTGFVKLSGFGMALFWLAGSMLFAQPQVALKPETAEAFELYTEELESDFRVEISGTEAHDWVRTQGDRLRGGEIIVEKMDRIPKIPDGLIHDWRGAVFLEGVSIDSARELLTDYDRHQEVYPEVVRSRILSADGTFVRGYLRLRKEKVFTVVLDTEHEMRILPPNGDLQGLISRSTRIAEVKDPDTAKEQVLPAGRGSGFLWRLVAFWGLQQQEEGAFLWCRSISLSRGLPWGIGWMIRPIVESTPREAFVGTLEATREALAAASK